MEDILSEGDSFSPFHIASQELSPSGRTVGWEGDAAISLPPKKVVAEELEDLALKVLARYATPSGRNNGRTFLESAGSHGEHDERVEAVIV